MYLRSMVDLGTTIACHVARRFAIAGALGRERGHLDGNWVVNAAMRSRTLIPQSGIAHISSAAWFEGNRNCCRNSLDLDLYEISTLQDFRG